MAERSPWFDMQEFSPTQLSNEDRREFESYIAEFEAAWHQQAYPNISEFLPSSLHLRHRVLEELLKIDSEFRRRLSGKATIDTSAQDYVDSSLSMTITSNSQSHDQSSTGHTEMTTVYSSLMNHASGGLGDILKSQEKRLGRIVAIKQLQSKWRHNSRARRAFLREAEITSQLEHPGIVPIYCSGETDDGRPCYSMRYIHGRTLQKAIEEFHQRPDYDSPALRSMLSSFVMVCNTVAFAHNRHIIHRDLKPDNVMLGPYGETLVLDWGMAKKLGGTPGTSSQATGMPEDDTANATAYAIADDEAEDEAAASRVTFADASNGVRSTTMPGDVVGTPAYMSPEQASGLTESVSYATDVFGLGAMLFAILYGRGPFKAQNPEVSLEQARRGQILSSVDGKRVPKVLQRICLKAMQFNPEDRYPSALAIAEDITQWLAGQPVSVMREPLWRRAGRFAGRKKTLAWTTLAVALLLVMTIIVAFYRISVERQKGLIANEIAKAQRDASKRIATFLSQAFLSDEFIPAHAIQSFSTPKPALHEVVARLTSESELLVTQTFEDDPPQNARLLMCLGSSYRALGQFEKAQALLAKSYNIRKELYGTGSLLTLESMHHLARLHYVEGNYATAESLMREAVEGYKTVESAQPLLLADAKYSLAWLLYWQPLTGSGPTEEALRESIQLFKEVLALREAHLPYDDATIGLACSGLAAALSCIDERADEAALYATRAVQIAQSTATSNSVNSFLSDYFRAERLRKQGDFDGSHQLYKSLEEQIRQTLGTQHPIFVLHLWNEAGLYNKFGHHDLAEQTIQTIRQLVRTQPSVRSSPFSVGGLFIYAEALANQHRESALDVCREALAYARERPKLNQGAIEKLESLESRLLDEPHKTVVQNTERNLAPAATVSK